LKAAKAFGEEKHNLSSIRNDWALRQSCRLKRNRGAVVLARVVQSEGVDLSLIASLDHGGKDWIDATKQKEELQHMAKYGKSERKNRQKERREKRDSPAFQIQRVRGGMHLRCRKRKGNV
jgi:hypothetical protein